MSKRPVINPDSAWRRSRSARPKKQLGQFFLRDKSIAERIAAQIQPGRLLVEVGPGDGSLTDELLKLDHRVVGVELDPDMVKRLERRFQHRRDLRLVSGSILKLDWMEFDRSGESLAIVGNLPYHLTSPILFNIFEMVRLGRPRIEECVVMVQREVGLRLAAEPGNKDYGSLTLLTQYHGRTEYLFTVPAASFYPVPGVDGGVIRIKFHAPSELPNVDYDAFRRIVRGCFTQRRKMMRNAINVVGDLPEGWKDLDFNFLLRPEQFSLADFIRLTGALIALVD
jgi:16S rRNA (adenine1518-N6/adenine1519-N6)-dimethyltransferase